MTLTPDDLRDLIDELDLSQKALARLLGISDRAVRRWCSGQNDIPDGLRDHLARVTDADLEEAR